MERVCEPELMEDEEQARAYAEADFSQTDQAFVAVILRHLRELPMPPARLLDLGCGPGNLSFPLTEALPQVGVLAVDGAAAMLAPALRRQRQAPASWPMLLFLQACLPLPASALSQLPEAHQPPFQVLVSNSLLHHLHDPLVLWRSLKQLGAPGALVMVRDLRRPDSSEELERLVACHVGACPPILQRDYRASLRAAFRASELRDQLRHTGLGSLRVEEIDDRYLEVSGLLP